MTRTLLRHSPLTSSQQTDTLLNQAGVRGRLPWKSLQLCHTVQHRKRVRSRKHRAREASAASASRQAATWPASDAGRPVAIRSKRGSAHRRPRLGSGTSAVPTIPGPGAPPTGPAPLPANGFRRRFSEGRGRDRICILPFVLDQVGCHPTHGAGDPVSVRMTLDPQGDA